LPRAAYVRVDVGGDALAGVIEPALDDLHGDVGLRASVAHPCRRAWTVITGLRGSGCS
jgi:hypothetical protein